MFDSDATLGASTTDYSTSEEITNTSGTAYTAGGATLTNAGVSLSSTTAFTDFSDVTYSSATFTANAALIYNTTTDGGSGTTDAVCAIAFGETNSNERNFHNSISYSRRYERYHKISIGGPLCRFNQDGVDSPGDKRIGTVMLYLQPVGVQKHGMMVVGKSCRRNSFINWHIYFIFFGSINLVSTNIIIHYRNFFYRICWIYLSSNSKNCRTRKFII